MTAVLQDQPMPARLVPWAAADPQSLAHCVLLALLVHLWLVLVLGTAPGGTAQPGQGVYGAINVTLRGPVSESASDQAPAATPVPGMVADSEGARWGGRVRQTEWPRDSLPGAERLGVPAAQAPQALPTSAPQALPTPAPQPLPMPSEQALPAPPQQAPVPAAPEPAPPPAPLERSLAAPPLAAPRAPEAALPRPASAADVSLPNVPALAALPTPGTLLQAPGSAGPDAGSRVGHDVATPAAAAASQPPRLNLELARPRGGELSRMATSGALPVLPRPPEVDDQLARGIDKAGKTDCRKAYAGAGLLAVGPLVADALRGQGCKW